MRTYKRNPRKPKVTPADLKSQASDSKSTEIEEAALKPAPTLTNKFTKVKEARELLREKSSEILEAFLRNAEAAHLAGEYEVAAKSLQWLLEHAPAGEGGERIVDTSVDKTAKEANNKPSGPRIQIGLAIGQAQMKALPSVDVIEVDPDATS